MNISEMSFQELFDYNTELGKLQNEVFVLMTAKECIEFEKQYGFNIDDIVEYKKTKYRVKDISFGLFKRVILNKIDTNGKVSKINLSWYGDEIKLLKRVQQ